MVKGLRTYRFVTVFRFLRLPKDPILFFAEKRFNERLRHLERGRGLHVACLVDANAQTAAFRGSDERIRNLSVRSEKDQFDQM